VPNANSIKSSGIFRRVWTRQ